MNIFITHAQKDRALASEMGELLSEAGFEVWSPAEQIWPADNWAKKIGKALEKAEFMVVLLTPKAIDSDWLRQTIQFALGAQKFAGHFFSVFLGPSKASSKELPWILRQLPHLEIRSEKDLSEAVEEIKAMALAPVSK